MNLKGRDFLKLLDFTPEEIGYLIDFAADLKAKKKVSKPRGSTFIFQRFPQDSDIFLQNHFL